MPIVLSLFNMDILHKKYQKNAQHKKKSTENKLCQIVCNVILRDFMAYFLTIQLAYGVPCKVQYSQISAYSCLE